MWRKYRVPSLAFELIVVTAAFAAAVPWPVVTVPVVSPNLRCLDPSGAPVDWWTALKAPTVSSSSDPLVAAGTAYVYTDANDASTAFQLTGRDITDVDSSPLALTLQALYDAAAVGNSTDLGFVFYDDEVPNSDDSDCTNSNATNCDSRFGAPLVSAHAKGVLGFGASGGFWLVHSVPKAFPAPANGKKVTSFSYPSSGLRYGQSFLCLSLPLAAVDEVGLQLQYFNPEEFDEQMDDSLIARLPNMAAFISGRTIDKAGSHVAELSTLGGSEFVSFAKNAAWGQDLYSRLVAPHFGVPLAVETWMRPEEDSYYPPDVPYATVNVLELQLGSGAAAVSFGESKDHSKWAVSQDASRSSSGAVPSPAVTCIGGINRQKSQWERGGGTVCLQDSRLWTLFNATIAQADPINPSRKSSLL